VIVYALSYLYTILCRCVYLHVDTRQKANRTSSASRFYLCNFTHIHIRQLASLFETTWRHHRPLNTTTFTKCPCHNILPCKWEVFTLPTTHKGIATHSPPVWGCGSSLVVGWVEQHLSCDMRSLCVCVCVCVRVHAFSRVYVQFVPCMCVDVR